MSKQLVTVIWSTTIEVDIPAGIDILDVDFRSPQEQQKVHEDILKEAWLQIQKSDGEITDVQSVEGADEN